MLFKLYVILLQNSHVDDGIGAHRLSFDIIPINDINILKRVGLWTYIESYETICDIKAMDISWDFPYLRIGNLRIIPRTRNYGDLQTR